MNQSSKIHIWITGANGFLGARLVRHFSDAGHKVVGIGRNESNADSTIGIDLASEGAPEKLSQLVRERGCPDVLIHAASKQPGPGDLGEFVSGNTKTTINVIDGLSQNLPPRIIYTSTHSVYTKPAGLPVAETAPAGGQIPYGATKRWSEEILMGLRDSQVIILRMPSLYGTGQRDSFIDGLARLAVVGDTIELFSGGLLVRDALHVSDAISAISSCATTSLEESSIINIGCGASIQTIEYARALVNALGSKSTIVPVDQPAKHFDLYADITKARRLIHFQPTALQDSMQRYADELRT